MSNTIKKETNKEALLRRIEERREFAEATRRFSDVGFYEELTAFIQKNVAT